MTRLTAVRSVVVACLLAARCSNALAATGPQADLDALVAERWEYQLKESPELTTTIGDDRYNDRWTDYSLDLLDARTDAWIASIEASTPTHH